MTYKRRFGYDIYYLQCTNVAYYLDIFMRLKIKVYFLKKIDTYTYQFYTTRISSYKLRKLDLPIQYYKSVGFIYYITLFFRNRVKMIGVITFMFSLVFFNQLILNIKVIGSQAKLNSEIIHHLKQNKISYFRKNPSLNQLDQVKSVLETDFANNIDWMNIYQKGRTIFVEYTNKQDSIETNEDSRPIIACKDAVIKKFQIEKGNILVQINQFVKKGDILVSNELETTSQEIITVFPKGKVYGYTWYDFHLTIYSDDEAEAFDDLLKMARDELSLQIGVDATIESEKIIKFVNDNGEYHLDIHYTVVENIACRQ